MLAYGAGQVAGTVLVPGLIRRRSAGTALLYGACGITAVARSANPGEVLLAQRVVHRLGVDPAGLHPAYDVAHISLMVPVLDQSTCWVPLPPYPGSFSTLPTAAGFV